VRSQAKAPFAGSTKGAIGRLGALLVVATAFLLAAAASVSAAPTAVSAYGHLADFGEGQVSQAGNSAPNGIAVEPGTGNIVVADGAGSDVDVFAPDSSLGGVPLTSFTTGDQVRSVAIDQGNGAVYVLGGGSLTRYLSDGAATPVYTPDPSFSPPALGEYNGGLAVDPTTHDLLVTEPNPNRISRLSPSGALLSSFIMSDAVGPGAEFPTSIAVGLDGGLYVVLYRNGQGVEHFDGSGAWLGSLPVEGTPYNVTVDPATGGAIVSSGNAGEALEGFTPSGERLYRVPAAGYYQRGLAIDGDSGRLYFLSFSFSPWPGVHVFVPATLPGVEAPVVSGLTTTGVHVSAEVDPGTPLPAESAVRFEYMPVAGSSWESTPDQPYAGSPVEADITGLSPNIDYLVRAVASNSLLDNPSKAVPFTTVGIPPGTVTGDATDVTETSAVLNGTINPVGLQSGYHFEYGLTSAYGSRIPESIEAVAGNGRAPRIFSRTIEGLQPGTTYHYRLVASNSAGVAEGIDRTLTTLTPGAIAHRAYEQVTPVDQRGGVIDNRLGFLAKADGTGMAYVSRPASSDLESSPWLQRSMSVRTGTAWNGGIGLDPPLGIQPGLADFTYLTTLGISADFRHSFVATDQKLGSDGATGATNLYVRDLGTGSYSLVASTGHDALLGFITIGAANRFLAAAPDFSWIVFASATPLMPGVTGTAVYRWSEAGGLELESTLPDGSPPAASVQLIRPSGGVRSVSADGTRDYFTLRSESAEDGVYLREDGQVRAISVSHIPGDPATVRAAQFLGTGKNGRFAFFASKGAALTSDAPGTLGDVYRYDADSDELEYLGAQAGSGFLLEGIFGVSDDGGTIYFETSAQRIEVWRDGALNDIAPSIFGVALGNGFLSPNGRYFAFSFNPAADLTVYLYDAETGEVSCVSCLSDGSPAPGTLPEAERFINNRTPQAVDDSGRLFFDTKARLVAADVNGESDVYVYQDGRASLISPGNAPFEARFADMSEDGSDVFFTTNQKLVGQDNNESPDIYDARTGGGLASQSPPPPQECLRDDCKATPNAGPELPFGGSEALSGPGNVTPPARKRCGKGRHARKVKGKARCVKQSNTKKNAKQANSNRRQAR
jgi:hypothetical protein